MNKNDIQKTVEIILALPDDWEAAHREFNDNGVFPRVTWLGAIPLKALAREWQELQKETATLVNDLGRDAGKL